eukprot:scpid28007/ scgid20591/ 
MQWIHLLITCTLSIVNGQKIKSTKKTEEQTCEQWDELLRKNTQNLTKLKYLLLDKGDQVMPSVQHDTNSSRIGDALTELVKLTKQGRETRENTPSVNCRLPQLKLPVFNGDMLEYTTFIDLFNATVDNKGLSNVEKLSYLKSHLSGRALECIAGLSLTGDHYEVALRLINERFGKPEVIAETHYMALIEMEKPSTRPESLKQFSANLEMHVRSLQALGRSIDQELLVPVIKSKLPRSVMAQLELGRAESKTWSFDRLRKALSRYVSALEATDQAQTTRKEPVPIASEAKSFSSTRVSRSAAEALVAHSTKRQPTCWYCKETHFTDECKRYPTLEKRKAEISRQCYNICLKDGHSARACRSARPCYHCHRVTHHRSLRPAKFTPSEPLNITAKPYQTYQPARATLADCQTPGQVIEQVDVQVHENCQASVMMQMAVAEAFSPASQQSCDVRILFDTGSTRSFISQSAQSTLEAEVIVGVCCQSPDLAHSRVKRRSSHKLHSRLGPLMVEAFRSQQTSLHTSVRP